MKILNKIVALILISFAPASFAQNPQVMINFQGGNATVTNTAGILPGNALQYCLGVACNDGNFHPVGTGAPAPWNVTTRAALVAAQPAFAWLTDTAGSTIPGECTTGYTYNCFLSTLTNGSPAAGGAYQYTDAMVANGTLDLGTLALQTCALKHGCQFEAGVWQANFPIMVPMAPEAANAAKNLLIGAGMGNTVFIPHRDFGVGKGFFMVGDPAAVPTANGNTSLGRYNNNGVAAGLARDFSVVNALFVPGTIVGRRTIMDGITGGDRLKMENIYVENFNHCLTVSGDHTTWVNFQGHACMDTVRMEWPNPNLTGNLQFHDINSTSFESDFTVAPGATLSAGIDGNSYLGSGGITILGEAATATNGPNGTSGCTAIANGLGIGAMTENIGLGLVVDQTGMPGWGTNGTAYVPTAKCRGLQAFYETGFHRVNVGNDSVNATIFPNGKRRSMIQVALIDSGFQITGLNDGGGIFAPNAGGSLDAGVAFMEVSAIAPGSLTGCHIDGDMDQFFNNLNGTPFIAPMSGNSVFQAEVCDWSIPGRMSGSFEGVYLPPGATLYKGDLLETNTNFGAGAAGFYSAAKAGMHPNNQYGSILGVSMVQGTVSGAVYPVANRGKLTINAGIAGYINIDNTPIYVNEGVAALVSTPGAGYTNGTGYTWTTASANCSAQASGTVDVVAGQFTNMVETTTGDCFQGGQTIALPTAAGTGTTAAVLTAVWPSGQGFAGAAGFTPSSASPKIGSVLQIGGSRSYQNTTYTLNFAGPVLPK